MLYRSNDNDRVFEVAVYNAKVRQLTDENQSHPYLSDHWANSHIQDIKAENEAEALKIAAERFPSREGFVIEQIAPSRYFQSPVRDKA
jgi:hypothetical protein